MTHPNTILLGIFTTPYFKSVANQYNTYPFYELVPVDNKCEKVIDYVKVAAFEASSILFILDDIEYSIEKNGVTCEELKLILSSRVLMDKTIFIHEGNEVCKTRVFELYGRDNKR
jgi:hypothetical protein